MQEAVYAPILDALADHKPRTLGQIEQAVKDKGVDFAKVIQATAFAEKQLSVLKALQIA